MADDLSDSYTLKMRAVFAALILVFIFAPVMFTAVPAPYWFHENFFNTLKIALNFREKGFPTFDGATPTNDFSLLWLLSLSGLSAVVSAQSTAFFILVRALSGISAMIALRTFNRLIDESGFSPDREVRFVSNAFLAALFFQCALTGSDAVWAITFIFINALCLLKALKRPSFVHGLACGLSVSMCAFARFDSAAFFLTALLVFYFQFNRTTPVTTKQALKILPGILIGLIPLMAYADILQTKFGSPVPAELLGWGKVQGMAPWRLITVVFYEPLRYVFQVPQAPALMTFPVILLPLVAFISFPWHGKRQTPEDTVFYALIWYPPAYLTALAVLTHLTLPDYAFYPLAVGGPFALLYATNEINSKIPEKEKSTARIVWLILAGGFLAVALSLAVKPRSPFFRNIVDAVAGFTAGNKGRYAMSAGAGITSYKTGAQIVRLDGAAEDLEMLKMIDSQSPLAEAFKKYGIEYYIAVNAEKGENCYSARVPGQNRFGGTNKGMSDWLCAEPVFVKQAASNATVAVFKIGATGKALSP